MRERLAKRASKAGIQLSAAAIEGLSGYFELLRKWNRKVSLTSLPVEEEGDEAIDRLLLEQQADGIRQLNFAAASGAGLLENVKDLGCQDIAADDRQV